MKPMNEESFSAASAIRDIADDLSNRKTYQLMITSAEARKLHAALEDFVYKSSHNMTLEEEGLHTALYQIGDLDPEPTKV